jgi:DNA-directed RNA polymerase subunit M/transcription elongation factor TFIIS
MQKITCRACQAAYWIPNWLSKKDCPSCGGAGIEAAKRNCSECGKAMVPSRSKFAAKTCGKVCSLAREARKAREKRQERGLTRQAVLASSRERKSLDAPLNAMRRCHDCGEATWDYRCPVCRAKWRAMNGADGLNGLADLFTAGRCFADVRI